MGAQNVRFRIPVLLFLMFAVLAPVLLGAAEPQGTFRTAERKLLVGVVQDPPYLVKDKGGEWHGLNVDIWKSIVRDLKVEYVFKEMSFPELLQALKGNEIDISIESFFLLAGREPFMDYSVPFGNARLAVVTTPEKISHPWWVVVKIFFSWGTLKVVALLGIVLCLLGLLLWIIERDPNPDHFGGGFIRGIGSGIYWVGSTLASGVCFGVSLKSLPARVFGLIWMLLCAVALSAFIASLTTSLVADRSSIQIVTEETLRHMHLGGIEGSAETVVIQRMGGTYSLYTREEDALKAVLNSEVEGFLYDEITLRYYANGEYKGRISVYPTSLRRFSIAFGMPKNSPWRTPINVALLGLIEKPDWIFLLDRYGLAENFEAKPAPSIKGKRM
jgi:polar amino acid transport system substrate-binding protein